MCSIHPDFDLFSPSLSTLTSRREPMEHLRHCRLIPSKLKEEYCKLRWSLNEPSASIVCWMMIIETWNLKKIVYSRSAVRFVDKLSLTYDVSSTKYDICVIEITICLWTIYGWYSIFRHSCELLQIWFSRSQALLAAIGIPTTKRWWIR